MFAWILWNAGMDNNFYLYFGNKFKLLTAVFSNILIVMFLITTQIMIIYYLIWKYCISFTLETKASIVSQVLIQLILLAKVTTHIIYTKV